MGWVKFLGASALALGLVVIVGAPVCAAALSQGYQVAGAVPNGSLVSLDATNSGKVVLANKDNASQLLGVVVQSSDSVLSVSASGTNIQVVTSGLTNALVSDLNGNISKGDPLTASPLNGVGMKATKSGRIIGYAQADFNSRSPGATTKSVASTNSGQQKVAIGTISVQVGVNNLTITPKTVLPPAVQAFIDGLAGRSVSTLRIVFAGLIIIFSLVMIVILVNSAVSSSINSLGRNPLARRAVSSGLVKVLLLAMAILLVSLSSVYFIIKG